MGKGSPRLSLNRSRHSPGPLMREAVGLTPGTTVDISEYGDGLHLAAGGRTGGRIVEEDGLKVITGEATLDDETMFRLIDAGRR